MMKKNLLIIFILLISIELHGCDSNPQENRIQTIKNYNSILKQRLNLLKGKSRKKEISASKLLNQAKWLKDREDNTSAKNFLNLLFMEFPGSRESEIGKCLIFEIEGIKSEQTVCNTEFVYNLNRQKIVKYYQNYIGLMMGTISKGNSLSLELARLRRTYMFGIGGAWMLTNDVSKTYYVSGSSSTLNSDLGYNNNGDEFEIYGLWGKLIKEKVFITGSLGVSQQKMVHLEKSSASSAIYAIDEKNERYLTYSLQLRYMMKNENILNIGYHNRRGFIAGLSFKL